MRSTALVSCTKISTPKLLGAVSLSAMLGPGVVRLQALQNGFKRSPKGFKGIKEDQTLDFFFIETVSRLGATQSFIEPPLNIQVKIKSY